MISFLSQHIFPTFVDVGLHWPNLAIELLRRLVQFIDPGLKSDSSIL
jgi:hypothetical protein